VSNEILTIVTGLLLLSSVLVPNLVHRWWQAKLHRANLNLPDSSTPFNR
jgi:rhamnose transport system permease protein